MLKAPTDTLTILSEYCQFLVNLRDFVDTCIEDGFGYQLEAGQEQDTVVWSLVLEDVGEEDTGLYRCQVSAQLLRANEILLHSPQQAINTS